MSLNGFDASSNNLGVPDKTISADFIIEKATEGIGYVNPDCNPSYQEALAAGKLVGVYHWGHPENNPVEEADFFVNQILGYIGTAALFLDYETNTDVSWAKQWLDRVYARTGVRPLIYLSESTANAVDWSPIWNEYGLWVAKYRDYGVDYNYDMTNAGPNPRVGWPYGYAMWQWTSVGRLDGYGGNLDCSIFYGTRDTWAAYARVQSTETTTTTEAPTTTTSTTDTPATTTTTTEIDTTTTTTLEPDQTTTTTTTESNPAPTPNPGLWAAFWAGVGAAIAWLINRLRGVQ